MYLSLAIDSHMDSITFEQNHVLKNGKLTEDIMKVKILSLLTCLHASQIASALSMTSANTYGLGFQAPQVIGKSNVSDPETGEIVFDSSDDNFYGYIGGSWANLGGGSPSATAFNNFGDTDTTLTVTDGQYVSVSITQARTLTLPTTNVVNGYILEIVNGNAFDLTINASGGNALTVSNGANLDATIRNGKVKLMAKQAAPTSPSHWRVLEVYETYDYSTTYTFTAGGGTTSSKTNRIVRNGQAVNFLMSDVLVSLSAASFAANSDTDLPLRFRPATSLRSNLALVQYANTSSEPGMTYISNSSGNIEFSRVSGGFTSGQTGGIPDPIPLSWVTPGS
jgi:hypothetical protein